MRSNSIITFDSIFGHSNHRRSMYLQKIFATVVQIHLQCLQIAFVLQVYYILDSE